MSAWGNKDDIASPGTVTVTGGTTVTGTATVFANNYSVGDVITITDSGTATILSISNSTVCTVTPSITNVSGKAFTVSEKPISPVVSDGTIDPDDVFGVDSTEVGVKFFRIATVAIANTGAGFANNAKVQLRGGTGTSGNVNITTDSQGVPSAVTIVNAGRYTVLPTLENHLPANFLGKGLRLKLTGTAASAANVAHAGWVHRKDAYTDAHGTRREKSEVLVAMSTITGDAADDADFPDS